MWNSRTRSKTSWVFIYNVAQKKSKTYNYTVHKYNLLSRCFVRCRRSRFVSIYCCPVRLRVSPGFTVRLALPSPVIIYLLSCLISSPHVVPVMTMLAHSTDEMCDRWRCIQSTSHATTSAAAAGAALSEASGVASQQVAMAVGRVADLSTRRQWTLL